MNNRKKRAERKEARAAKAPAPVPVHKIAPPAPAASNRSTIRVAQAKRALVDQLPINIRSRSFERLERDDKRPSLSMAEPVNAPPPPSIPKRKPLPTSAKSGQPRLEGPKPSPLKCRPKDNKPKGAAGSGRSFVPWNQTCET